MLSYPAAIPLSTRSLNHLAGLIRTHRRQRRSRWRRLDPGRQALLALAHLRNGDNRGHARIRAIGERANATHMTWKVLTKLRCSPHRATQIVQAILVLHHVENPAYSG
ncbi:hypothetical protein [Actinoplanes sp. NPDC051851]|uniref:hypothetical protein n=1 Tax=Actinoplanes sp. NPDC051851 TaxID=3154753 RepID=UPI0034341C71